MSTAAHSKDNGSPTSVAHNLDDSVVVRRDDLVVIDNAALGTLCEDVQIASRRNAGVLEVEWFRNGAELTLFHSRRPELDLYEERPPSSFPRY